MNSNGGGPYSGFAPQGINPAMLASYGRQQQQAQYGPGVSPAQLMNGGMGNMMTPSHMLQQQQQQQMMMMNGGLNPAALSAAANGMHLGGGGAMNPASLMNSGPGPMAPQMATPQIQMTPQVQQILANMGITREHVAQMGPVERQAAMKNVMLALRQQQAAQQQMQQQQQFAPDNGFFDRPGSAMGMGMGGGGNGAMGMGMMPPPRPGTAQGMAGMRSGNAMGMHQPQGMGGGGGMGMNMGMGMGGINPAAMGMGMGGGGGGPMGMGPRPPSRAASLGAGDFQPQNANPQQQNGFQPGKPQGTPQFGPGFGGGGQGMPPQQQPQPPQNMPQGSPPPGSPFNRAKRKLAPSDPQTQSPRISAMGPPSSVLRSSSAAPEANGFPRPPSSNGTPQRQVSFGPGQVPPRPQTPQRQPSIPRSAVAHEARDTRANGLRRAPLRPRARAHLIRRAAAPSVRRAPPLPASVNLNPAVTRVTVVPLATSLTTIPPVSAEEVADVQGWMARDRAYEGAFRAMRSRMGAEVREAFGPRSIPWWEKGTLDVNASRFLKGREQFDVRYPYRKKEREGGRRKGTRREGIRLPRKIDAEDANRPEQLVPIRLEFDVEHHKMRDTFVWNLNDPVISPENFAQTVVEDYNLAPTYHAVITKTIQDQLSDYRAHSANYDGDSWDVQVAEEDTLQAGALEGKSAAWWSAWRKRLRSEYGFVRAGRSGGKGHKRRKVVKDEDDDMDAADERPMAVEEFTFDQKALHDDMRILIRLDIIVGSIKLDDQFEWDLDNVDASPEGFAEIYAKELGLGPAISHAIREQVQAYQKTLFLVGHPTDGTPVQDEDLRSSLLPSLSSGARAMDQVQAFTPQLNYLSDGELERHEKERDKDVNRRRKRNRGGRRGLDAATLAAAAAATAPMSRRAAAAAASVTIANMVASENGERAYTPSALPTVPMPPPLVIKEKTRIPAPVPSTAMDISKLPAPLENDPPPPPTSNVMPPDSRAGKAAVAAKRVKEPSEREAKEKEFADGQRRNMINGVWHCSNCGCPESIATGRRKGPLGAKSQCGTCGKYWHRHRRPRPVEYNSDLEYHANLKREADIAKTLAKRRGGAAALRAQSGTMPATPADTSEPPTPRDSGEGPSRQSGTRDVSPVSDASSASERPLAQTVKINGSSSHSHSTPPVPQVPPPPPEPVNLPSRDPPPVKPVPTPSPVAAPASIPPPMSAPPQASAPPQLSPPSEPTSFSAPPPTPPIAPPPTQSSSSAPPAGPGSAAVDGAVAPPRAPGVPSAPPQWLTNAMSAMQAKWKNDKFEVTLRKVNASPPEWRLKCLDCPGKLYTPGPGETLSNYEVHLRNRLHRQRVNDRMASNS
ncbi:hypothetical protein FB451DRAFT_1443853 [Mycena latifolia]|nr:hypothetical protein FB451DRAFT_1443853 [Mycena latifolia]